MSPITKRLRGPGRLKFGSTNTRPSGGLRQAERVRESWRPHAGRPHDHSGRDLVAVGQRDRGGPDRCHWRAEAHLDAAPLKHPLGSLLYAGVEAWKGSWPPASRRTMFVREKPSLGKSSGARAGRSRRTAKRAPTMGCHWDGVRLGPVTPSRTRRSARRASEQRYCRQNRHLQTTHVPLHAPWASQ